MISRPTVVLLALACVPASACTETNKRSLREPAGARADGDEPADDAADDDDTVAKKPKKKKPADDGTDDKDKEADKNDDGEPPADAGTTGGKGGATGRQELKSAGGLSYQINAPAEAATGGPAYGLLVLLHGSGRSNYAQFVGQMAEIAKEQRLIAVSVLAPNGSGWNEGGEERAADLLHRLVQEDLFPKYEIAKSRIVFSGQSSGGGFLASHFVPLHAKDYQGGAFMQCGATPPEVPFAPDDATKKAFKLHFEITTGDPIWPQSYNRALEAYGKAGMQLTKDDTKPGGHCNFDQQAVIRAHIAAMIPAP